MSVTIAACDIADREAALNDLLVVPSRCDRPLRAVFHLAGRAG